MDDHKFVFIDTKTSEKPVDLELHDLFGKPPRTILKDIRLAPGFKEKPYEQDKIVDYLNQVLQLEAVACKDWLTNKVDRSVTGRIAMQQCAGPLQLPLNNLGVVALDYQGIKGIATSLGQAPVAALIDPAAGSRLAVAEALTNLVWAPIEGGLEGVSLSANWMWPCKQPGEDARLYEAVEALSKFAIALGINVPTGKDSLSMTQKYPDGKKVYAPGTVIVTAVGEVSDIRKTISPVLLDKEDSYLLYLDFSGSENHLGGSSFAQTMNYIGNKTPDIMDPTAFKNAFNAVQELINQSLVHAGHDVASGGFITSLLEMCFARPGIGLEVNLGGLNEKDIVKLLFAEKPGVFLQVSDLERVSAYLKKDKVPFYILGKPLAWRSLQIISEDTLIQLDIDALRDTWYSTSWHLDSKQCGEELAHERFKHYKNQSLAYHFPVHFSGKLSQYTLQDNRQAASGIRAAIIREKGVNGDREMAYSLFHAGFDVKDVHMTDLISGRENLEDVNMIVFVGGFSNSDVLGSAKGWAGAFLYNEKARLALQNFYAREDTLSLGICNGCQVMIELGLVYPDHTDKPKMHHNKSHKFESGFINVTIPDNNSVMLASLSGSRLGVWIAHGEGRFFLPDERQAYNVVATYSQTAYPGNPNGSDYCAAALASDDGRHLVMMPHLERSYFPWQWAHYPEDRLTDEVSPWVEAFINAREWISKKL
jgi:phosphoribosylformylglycinamidine synthase